MKLPPKGRPYLFLGMWKIQQAVVEKLLRPIQLCLRNAGKQGKIFLVPIFYY
jgi:hypothetical protein